MKKLPVLRTERLQLLPAHPGQTEAVLAYLRRNADFFEPWLPTYPQGYFEPEFTAHWLDAHAQAAAKDILCHWFLWHKDDHKGHYVLGDLTYSQIQRGPAQCAFLGYKLDQKVLGQGLMTEALKVTNAFMFNELQLHRIEANIMPRNEASWRLAERLGFVREGLAKALLKINGRWEDHYRYALLNPKEERE